SVLPSLTVVEALTTAAPPGAVVLSPDADRLFVACASSSTVWVFNVFSGEALEQISMSLYPNAPATSTPNALSLSPDGKTLLVANADNNAVAVVDVSNGGRSFVNGFVPTGWYPTGAIFNRDGAALVVLSGKGLVPAPKPTDGGSELRLQGAVSMIAMPDRVTLADYTRRVLALTPYTDAAKLSPPDVPVGSPIPQAVGSSSPIKHVFYVIRENPTHDSIPP